MDSRPRFDLQEKVICIGNSGVGKSSLAVRFCDDEFSPSFISTIGVDFKYRVVNIDDHKIRLLLWDTAGQERYRTITQAFYRGSHGVLLVYDISDYSSFEGIRKWADDLDIQSVGNPKCVPRLLVGNKTDMTNRAVSTEQGKDLAEQIGAMFCETSAKYSEGVTAAFVMLAKKIWTIQMESDSNIRFANRSGDSKSKIADPSQGTTVIVRRPAAKSWSRCCSSEQCVGYTEEVVRTR